MSETARYVDLDQLPADLRRQITSMVESADKTPPKLLALAEAAPTVVFTLDSERPRQPGDMAQVTNGLDTQGGTIVSRVGNAWLVDCGGAKFVVHEKRDSWRPVDDE